MWTSRPLLALAAGAALFSFLFLPDLLDGRVFAYRDAGNYHLPVSRLVSAELRAGRLPFWNPVIACGTPLAANPNNYAWYPTRALELVLSPEAALQAHFFLHWIAGGAAMAALAGALGASVAGSAGAAALYLLAGPALSLLNFANLVPFLLWAPATMLAAVAMRRSPGPRAAAGLAVCLGVQTTFAEPGMLAAEALAVVAVLSTGARGGGVRVGPLAAAVRWSAVAALLALLVSAPMWVPELRLIAGSARAADVRTSLASSVPAPALAQLAVPQFLGDYHTPEKRTFWGEPFNQGFGPFFLSLSFGTVSLASAAAAVAARPRPALPLGALAVTGVLVAMGRHFPPLAPLYEAEAAGWFRWPVKLVFATALAVPPLAALAWSAIGSRDSAAGRAAAALAGAALLMALAAIVAGRTVGDPQAGTGWLGNLLAPVASVKDPSMIADETRARLFRAAAFAAAGAAAAAVAGLQIRRQRALPGAPWALAAIAVLELAGPQRAVNRGTPVGAIRDDAPVLKDARAIAADGYRVEFPRAYWEVRMPPLPGLPDEVWPRQRLDREFGNFFTAIGEGVPMVFLNPDRLVTPGASFRGLNFPSLDGRSQQEILRLLGVRGRVVAGRPALLADRPPYPTLAGIPITVTTDSSAVPIAAWLSSLPELEGTRPWTREFLRPAWAHVEAARDPSALRIVERFPGRWKLVARSGADGWVALTETADPGWRARVDGAPAEVVPYLADFQAVRVPAGEHVVEWDYRPPGLPWLLAMGTAGAAGIVALAVRGGRATGRKSARTPQLPVEL
jgi:hypothetical protein